MKVRTSLGSRVVVALAGWALALGALVVGASAATAQNNQISPVASPSGSYWTVASDGGVFGFGPGARFFGSMGGKTLAAPVVGMAAASGGNGYYEVASDGGVFTFGPDATFYGSMGGKPLDKPIVAIAPVGTGGGYFLIAADGGVFAFGPRATFYGSMGGKPLNAPVVGGATAPDGSGYYLVASDGGIFNFGPGAAFHGSMGGRPLKGSMVGMAVVPKGSGYWIVASDGGVFSFGPSAMFYGSMGGQPLGEPMVGMAAAPDGQGYWTVASDGGVFAFGPGAVFSGSMGGRPLNAPMVGIAGAPGGGATAAGPASLRIMNYYPADDVGGAMWTDWHPAVIDADFGRVAGLNANTVRVIVQTSAFGYPQPLSTMINELAQVISMAASHNLKVQLTLFDGFSLYPDIAGSETWAREVLASLQGDPRIAFVEAQNEIDPANPLAVSWAKQLIPYLQSIDGGLPVTISVCGCDNVGNLVTLKNGLGTSAPDFWDIHFYGNPSLALSYFTQAKALVSPAPLIVGETGYATYAANTQTSGLPRTSAAQEAYQDQFYRTVGLAAQQAGLPPAAPWILSDFSATCLCGPEQMSFGLYRLDGSAKPAAATVASILAGQPIDTSFNNGVEVAAGAANVPANWRVFGYGFGTFARDPTVDCCSGAASASLGNTSTVPPNSAAPCWFVVPVEDPVVGRHYTVNVWVKGSSATGTDNVSLSWWDAGGHLITSASSANLSGTTGWTVLSASGTAPSGAVQTEIALCSAQNSGTVWFDDVTLE